MKKTGKLLKEEFNTKENTYVLLESSVQAIYATDFTLEQRQCDYVIGFGQKNPADGTQTLVSHRMVIPKERLLPLITLLKDNLNSK